MSDGANTGANSGANTGSLRPQYMFLRKARDRSLAVLLGGIVFFMPPVAGIFRIDGSVFGIPIVLLYVFLVWMLLIVCAVRLRPALQSLDEMERATAPARQED